MILFFVGNIGYFYILLKLGGKRKEIVLMLKILNLIEGGFL